MAAVSAGGTHHAEVRGLLIKYGTDQDPQLDPLHTVTTKHHFGLVTIKCELYEIADIGNAHAAAARAISGPGLP